MFTSNHCPSPLTNVITRCLGYVLFLFSVFFTVAEPERLPRMKARAFYTKSGTQRIKRQLSHRSTTKRRSSQPSRRTVADGDEQLPDWEDETKNGTIESEKVCSAPPLTRLMNECLAPF